VRTELLVTTVTGVGLELRHHYTLYEADRRSLRTVRTHIPVRTRCGATVGDGTAPVDRFVEAVPPAIAVYALALLLLAISVMNLIREIGTIGLGLGPVFAVSINAALSLGVCQAGQRLSTSSLAPGRKPVVAMWCLGGTGTAVLVVWFTVFVRELEGRTEPESVFALVVITALGGLFGGRIGFLYESQREEVARASEVRDAMAFTNSLL
jgi:hypothetical protein